MLHKLKILYENNKIWIYLIRTVSISFFIAIIVILIDTGFIPIIRFIPEIFLTSVDLARNILAILAGSLLTITTFTFSTIMVVLTTYSSNFSPRVVENFLTDRITMKVLGIFVGGFFYCISALFFMETTLSNAMVISASIAVIYSIVCIAYFIKFVYTVSSSIQASKLINKLYDKSSDMIEKAINYRIKNNYSDSSDVDQYPNSYDVSSETSGYIELIDFKTLMELTADIDCKIVVRCTIGDFISKNTIMFTVYYHSQEDLEEKFDKKIYDCMTLTDQKMTLSDYKFSIQKIVEVALRAISPGINDPNTAIHCIRILGVLLGSIGEHGEGFKLLRNNTMKGKVIYEDFVFKRDLYDTFHQIVHYGKSDISVVSALFESLDTILRSTNENNINEIKSFAQYIFDKSSPQHENNLDRIKLQKYLNDIKTFSSEV
ncbi:DUF2254 domain-containing protein [Alkalibacter mobilis]|uniref:DUF2254 domain-containing protein n=1 Tax=Alkalibacter mobilis TaxID=2787712 RepID=UPI00189E3760|nr:DUF2254 domain-containing protein [Alkalibacter mobilis]MBF7097519.1 DUF2254 domain-containing protein [Alkalibacter mobilis]